MSVAFVFLPWPKESAKSIALSPRDDVHVKMWNALADDIVDSDERSLGMHRILHRHGYHAHIVENGVQQCGVKIRQRRRMPFRDQQAMPRKQWPVVEKDESIFVFPYAKGIPRIILDGAERAFTLDRALS